MIRNWIKGTGNYKIGEFVLAQGSEITNFAGGTVMSGITATGYTHAYTSGAQNIAAIKLVSSYVGLVGHKYIVTFDVTINSGSVTGAFTISAMGKAAQNITAGSNTYIIEGSNGVNGTYISINSSTAVNYTISNFKMYDLTPLPTITTGTKFLENTTAGTTAIQSKTAYGEWEFDVYKGADWNAYHISFISDDSTIGLTSVPGYYILLGNDEAIYLYRKGSLLKLANTAASYISNNTWYRIKVARLQSEGVFKDIPTLQTSNMVQSTLPAFQYDTFISNGRYGFRAVCSGKNFAHAGTAQEIPIVNTAKYLIEFDLKLNSGAAPNMSFETALVATTISNTITNLRNGRNSVILTATSTATGVLSFRSSVAADYEISGLTIRRIYPANSFAVFIKGGAYGNTETGWTLVSTTGGSGTNPVVDSTYTTSNYFVADLDAGDRLANLKIMDGVKQ